MKIPYSGRRPSARRHRLSQKNQQEAPADLDSIVINSVDWRGRKVPLSYGGHVCGWHPVRPGHGSIQFESLIERNAITALAKCSWVKSIASQPVTIEYQINGARHSYTPDLLVRASSIPEDFARLGIGAEIYIECKPHRLVDEQSSRLERHFHALRIALGASILLITDRDLSNGFLESRHD